MTEENEKTEEKIHMKKIITGMPCCPEFEGEIKKYKDWKKRVQLWLEMGGKDYENPGAWIMNSLKGKGWDSVAKLNLEEIKQKDNVHKIFKELDKNIFKGKQNRKSKDRFFQKMERKQEETMRDYIIRFEKEKDECKEAGVKIDEETLRYLIILKGNITNIEKAVIMGACGDNMEFNKVKNEMIKIKQIEEIKQGKQETLIIEENKGKCFKCGKDGHWARQCKKCKWCKKENHREEDCWFKKEDNGREKRKCEICKKDNHREENCWFKNKNQ